MDDATVVYSYEPLACASQPSREALQTYHLRFPTTLHQGLPLAVLGDGLDVVGKARDKTRQRKEPED